MHYVEAFDRNQIMMVIWDSMFEIAWEGRPTYVPKSPFKLYIYGNNNGIKFSRKLEKSC